MNTTGFYFNLDPNLKSAAIQKAKLSGQNLSTYLSSLISKDTGSSASIKPVSKQSRYIFSKEEQDILNRKANNLGVTPNQYLRDLITSKTFVKYEIEINDLDELLQTTYDLSKSLNGLLMAAHKSGVSQGDVNRIIHLMTDCNNTINEIYKTELSDRKKLYKEMKKRLEKLSKENKNGAQKGDL